MRAPLHRRDLLAWFAAVATSGAVTRPRPVAAQRSPVLTGPIVGLGNDGQLRVMVEFAHGTLLDASADCEGARVVSRIERPLPGIELARFRPVRPGAEARYALAHSSGAVITGRFRFPPARGAATRLAFGADFHWDSRPFRACDRVVEAAPDAFFALGDQMYADASPQDAASPDAESYASLYRRNFGEPAFARMVASVPTVMVWDDHETWNDWDATVDPVRARAARVAYDRFQRPTSEVPGTFRVGAAEVFVLDTRAHRGVNASPDGPMKSMLGLPQFERVVRWLETCDAPLRVLASPTPFNRRVTTGTDAFDRGYAYERDLLFAAIARNRPERVLLVSGDQHFAGVFRFSLPGGRTVVEAMFTPTAAPFRVAPRPGPETLYLQGDVMGFGLVDVRPDGGHRLAFVDDAGRERFALDHA